MVADPGDLLVGGLGDRYRLEGAHSRGGMATVYRARDLVRGEAVAIKVMHPPLATARNAERFLREITVTGAMRHPNVVSLYDSGSVGAVPYYVMPWIAGESLHERLSREGRLPLGDALGIARDVAAGLGYAHARQVLHRDVKPENILLDGARALVADFGLARAIGAAEYQRLTETGVIVGTVLYMSPEQLREDPDLDARSDIYGLACILFEMLAGNPPFLGGSIRELASRILRASAPSLRASRPEVPASVAAAISRALAKVPAERFGTMAEFVAALEG